MWLQKNNKYVRKNYWFDYYNQAKKDNTFIQILGIRRFLFMIQCTVTHSFFSEWKFDK